MSGYTPELKELIKKVEATRPQRVERARKNQHFPALNMEQRKEWLSKYHPDYKNKEKKAVKIGPNKGDVFPEEVANLLESKSRINPKNIDLTKTDYETDVLVIGAGGAGTAAALIAQESGCKVIVATKLRHGDSNTVMAEGGIQGADRREIHHIIILLTQWAAVISAISLTWLQRLPTMRRSLSTGLNPSA